MKCVLMLCALALACVGARPSSVKVPTEALELVEALKPILRLLNRRDALAAVEKQDFGVEDVTGAIKDVTGYIHDISKTIGPALNSIFGKRDTEDVEDILLAELLKLVDVYKKIAPYLPAAKTRDVTKIDVQDFGLEDITGAIKDVTGYIHDISKTIGPALNSIALGKRSDVPIEIQNTDWDKVLDDLKGIGKDLAGTFANVGPALVSVFGKRDTVQEIQDFGLEDITGAIKDVTGVISNIAGKIGPALSIISLGKRDNLPIEIQDTDWNKVLEDLKGIGKDLAGTFANVGPALISAFGKREEIQHLDLEDITGVIKDVTGYINDISKQVGPALGLIALGKRDQIPVEIQSTDWDKVLDDLKGIGKDLASTFANVGPALITAFGKRETQDFGLEDITGAIKDVTGYIHDISKTIGPALNSIALGKRSDVPIEIQNTDWDKVLDDLKGIGKDLAGTFANVGPALVSVFGKRDNVPIEIPIEIQNTDWDKVLDDLKGIGKDLAGTFANVGPALVGLIGK